MNEKIKNLYCFNKDDILEMIELNMHLSPYMQHVVEIVKQLDLPDLEEVFDFEKYPNEALVYELDTIQECTFPIVAISINRIYNIKTIGNLRDSHNIMYSIPIVTVPMECNYYLRNEDIENIDEESSDFDFSFNYFYGRE